MIKKFFTESFNFWLISRIILSLILIISSSILILEGGLRTSEIYWNLIGLIEGFILIIITIIEFTTKSELKIIKVIAGVILILFGLILFAVLLNVSEGAQSDLYPLGYLLSICIILIGIFEIMNLKKLS
jgi:hypothetical protein